MDLGAQKARSVESEAKSHAADIDFGAFRATRLVANIAGI